MRQLLEILEKQQDVQHLTYFLSQDRLGIIHVKLSACTINKKYKFKDENACLNKIIDILYKLAELEKWAIKRAERENVKYRK